MLVAANGAGVKAGRAATARAMAVVTSQVLTRCVYTDGHFFRLFSTNNHKGPPSRRSCQLPVPHTIYTDKLKELPLGLWEAECSAILVRCCK